MLLAFLLATLEPAWATGLGMTGPGWSRNPAEAYCMNYGGVPQSGKCYFPDGGYCDLWSFYNGTCPSRADREQAMWEAEMYAWLHNDNDYYPPFGTYGYSLPVSYIAVGGYGTATYWLSEANRLYLAGSYDQAAAMYTRALNLDPYLLAAWLNLGNSLYFLGRYQESLNAYEYALRLNPKNANAWQGKGLNLMALNRTNDANAALAMASSML
jgi:tetratricopeptide (TPR) repeat protein